MIDIKDTIKSNIDEADKLYRGEARVYVDEVLHNKKLTISQKLNYPNLIEFVCHKVYDFRYIESRQNIKFLEESCERYVDYFPELFV